MPHSIILRHFKFKVIEIIRNIITLFFKLNQNNVYYNIIHYNNQNKQLYICSHFTIHFHIISNVSLISFNLFLINLSLFSLDEIIIHTHAKQLTNTDAHIYIMLAVKLHSY